MVIQTLKKFNHKCNNKVKVKIIMESKVNVKMIIENEMKVKMMVRNKMNIIIISI